MLKQLNMWHVDILCMVYKNVVYVQQFLLYDCVVVSAINFACRVNKIISDAVYLLLKFVSLALCVVAIMISLHASGSLRGQCQIRATSLLAVTRGKLHRPHGRDFVIAL